jgi:hypothetical protein
MCLIKLRLFLDVFIIILFLVILFKKSIDLKDLFKPRTIFTGLFYGVFCYLILKGIDVPPALNTIVSTLFGYWFGSRNINHNGNIEKIKEE